MKHPQSVYELNQIFSGNLARIRRASDLAQHQLADCLGITFQQVQKIECGANRCSVGRAVQISQALDVPLQDLIPLPQIQGSALLCETYNETAILRVFRKLTQQQQLAVMNIANAMHVATNEAAA